MSSEQEIEVGVGFTLEEKERIDSFLERLWPYFKQDTAVIVGGLAIRYHLAKAGIAYGSDLNDLDLILLDANGILPGITDEFLISHHHLDEDVNGGEEKKPYWALVDPKTKTKVDAFGNFLILRDPVEVVKIGTITAQVCSAEDQLVKTVFDTMKLVRGLAIDPKQLEEMRLLAQIVDMNHANEIWQSHPFSEFAPTLQEAIALAEEKARERKDLIVVSPYHKPPTYTQCPECIIDTRFPLTPLPKIREILNYVE